MKYALAILVAACSTAEAQPTDPPPATDHSHPHEHLHEHDVPACECPHPDESCSLACEAVRFDCLMALPFCAAPSTLCLSEVRFGIASCIDSHSDCERRCVEWP